MDTYERLSRLTIREQLLELPLLMGTDRLAELFSVKPQTIRDWTSVGCNGVRLQKITTGARTLVSREALIVFLDALQPREMRVPPSRTRASDEARADAIVAGLRNKKGANK